MPHILDHLLILPSLLRYLHTTRTISLSQQHSTRRLSQVTHVARALCVTVLAPCRKGDLVGSKGTRNHPFAPAERCPHCGEVLTSGPLACGVRPPRWNSCFTSPTTTLHAPSNQIMSVLQEAGATPLHIGTRDNTVAARGPHHMGPGERSSHATRAHSARSCSHTSPALSQITMGGARASKRESQGEAS